MNHELFYALHNLAGQSQFFDNLIKFFAVHADSMVIALAVIWIAWLTFVHRDHPKKYISRMVSEALDISVSLFISWITVIGLKQFFAAPRPIYVLENIHPLFLYGAYEAFPSGHAAVFFALATAVFFYHRGAGVFFYLCAILISLARVIAGIHFPMDIVSGAFVGILVSSIIFLLIGSSKYRK